MPGWFPRPAEGAWRAVIGTAALAGFAISAYLSVVHLEGSNPVCLAGGTGCSQVQNSDYAVVGGIPVPLLGLAGYLAIAVSAAVRGDRARLGGFFLAAVGAGFSAYLTYLEIWVIEAICQWCVASAVLMIVIGTAASVRLVRFYGKEP